MIKNTSKMAHTSQPMYRDLASSIHNDIKQGIYSDNCPIPSERELVEQHKVSRDTVRKAVRYLEERGVLYSEHGRGTYVSPALARSMTRFLDGFSEDSKTRGHLPSQKIISIEKICASMSLASLISVSPGQELTKISRVRLLNGKPIGLQDAYLKLPKNADIKAEQLLKIGSLYKLLREHYSIIPTEAIENLSVATADEDEAQLLNVNTHAPLLICERITLSEHREPIEYCLMKYVESYRYHNRINKHGI